MVAETCGTIVLAGTGVLVTGRKLWMQKMHAGLGMIQYVTLARTSANIPGKGPVWTAASLKFTSKF